MDIASIGGIVLAILGIVAGMMIEVGFENDDVAVAVAPTLIVKVTVPRLVAPSCSAKVATRSPPQNPATVNVNGLATVGPPGTRTP